MRVGVHCVTNNAIKLSKSMALWPLKVGISLLGRWKLENVEHCGGEPEQADPGILCH